MSAQTFPLRRNPLPANITLLLAVLIGLMLARTLVVHTSHAVRRHGEDAQSIRSCIDNKGPAFAYRAKADPDKFYFACQVEDHRWGVQVVRWDQKLGAWVEKTAFIRGKGKLDELIRYLETWGRIHRGPLP